MRKILKRTGLALIGIIIFCVIAATVLFWSEPRSLSSIKKMDDYNLPSLSGVIFADRNTDNLIEFELKP